MISTSEKVYLIQQLECVICGTYEDLSSIKYTKTYKHKTGYKRYTYETKSILVPICDHCREKKNQRRKRQIGVILALVIWCAIFFSLVVLEDLFFSILPIAIIGILVFALLYVHMYAIPYNLRTAVKFSDSLGSKATWIFSRKNGDWISFESWTNDIINDKKNDRIITPKRFPQKKTSLFKLQYIGTFLIFISALAPSRIFFSGDFFLFSWLAGISLYGTPSNVSFVEYFTGVVRYSPYSYGSYLSYEEIISIGLGLFFIFVIIAMSFYMLRNSTYFAKTERSLDKVEKNYLFCTIATIFFAFIMSIEETWGFDSFTFLNIQFLMIMAGSAMILYGYVKAKNKDFRVKSETYGDIDLITNSKTSLQSTLNYTVTSNRSQTNIPPTLQKNKFCGYCGKLIESSSKFCTGCGKPI